MNRLTLLAALSAFVLTAPAAFAQQTTPAAPPALTPVPAEMPVAAPREKPAYVIIKIDDLVAFKGGVNPLWIKTVDYLKARKVPCAVGIICNSLEGDTPKYFQWIKDQKASGLVEFWCHGYDHKQWEEDDPATPGKKKTLQEFHGTPFEHQRDALAKSEALAKEKLGFSLPAFGAGFNGIDASTVKAIQAVPDVTVWLYGDPKAKAALPNTVILDRVGAVNIEQPTFVPNFEKFVAGFNRYPKRDIFVIQGHPTHWDNARFAQFVGIVDFLTKNGAIFTTPSEYAKGVK